MTSPSPVSGRPVTLAGLRVLLFTMAGFQLLGTACALFFKGVYFEVDTSLAESWLPPVAVLAVAETAAYFVLRFRLKKAWLREAASPFYQPGGGLPSSYVQATLIGAALVEGIGLLNAAMYLLSGAPLAILLAGFAFFLILAFLPREEDSHTLRGSS